jgi:hypothetical protein
MLLRSHEAFDIIGDYNPETGEFVPFSRSQEPERPVVPVSGTYGHIAGRRVMLFRLDGDLTLQIDGWRLPMENYTVTLRSENGNHVFQVSTIGGAILEWVYAPPTIDPPLELDPTPFVEEEDFDFGLFLANVSSDRGRQDRSYTESVL